MTSFRYQPLDYLDIDADIPIVELPDPPSPPSTSGSIWKASSQNEVTFASEPAHAAPGDDGDDPRDTPPWRLYGEEMEGIIKRPLIFIGGILGSTLAHVDVRTDANGNDRPFVGHNVWPPIHMPSGTGVMTTHALQHLTTRPKVPTGLFPNVYDPLLTFLQQEMGYVLNETLFIFPYDWTQSNLVSGRKFAGFIQRVIASFSFSAGEDEEVDIIAHSMGGIVTRSAAILYSAPVNRTVYLASPHYGASKAYFTLHPEIPTPLHDNVVYNYVIEQFLANKTALAGSYPSVAEALKGVASEMRSAYELLPDDFYFNRRNYIMTDLTQGGTGNIVGWNNTYRNHGNAKFPTNQMRLWAFNAMLFKLNLGENLPGNLNLVLYSNDHKTPERGFIHGDADDPGWSTEVKAPGDATVPEESAKGPGFAIRVPGDHNGVPNNRSTFYWIARFLATT